ncbi:branched-chain amino acid ABC transporter permease [Faecalicoccus pleomorphus]|uniref:Branched-chain amino acid ABC transporter permease n=2 Tax=Erysipelotrichaceae TaxID=128827 RepID=A0A3E3E449_9FIRM|nr:AzlC family ABC transporter permease [Faecalicoccus pleomorphus]MCI6380754.1 AzlC family ABC transporter permease [Erysipelotrichaceae bacterium]RGD76116.1 branched-chain amino acid ABC transporter permease [Faecalicoccus pleomorphus]
MCMILNSWKQGLQDGIPIALGYVSVSFAFGMMASNQGIPVWASVLISFSNLTSAGQFAGLGIIAANGSMMEMALSQFVINVRYFLMSLSLTQKLDEKTKTLQRAVIAHGITDEIFALSSSKPKKVGFLYMISLMFLPILGWTGGTFLGATASTLLPVILRDSLGIMIYGMFLAIIIPPCRTSKNIGIVVLMAAVTSCLFQVLSAYISIGSGFVIILCTLFAAGVGAFLFPIDGEEQR